jgi:hypothetical protein
MKKSTIAIGAVVVVMAIGTVQNAIQQQQSTTTEPATAQAAPAPAPAPAPATVKQGVTLAQFNQLHDGMTYTQAVAVLGFDGELISESTFGGIRTAWYQWNGTTFLGNMNAMFQNDALIQRAQLGLR